MERDIDLDRELRAAGVANLLAGLGGGLVGFQTLSLSTLGHKMCPSSRLVGLTSAAVCGAALALGASVLSFFPKPALGGLLLFLGLAFLVEWVVDAWSKLPRGDYFIVLLILVVIATVGFLESVGVGIVIAVVLFVVNYSRIDVVKHALSGASHPSNVDRPADHRRLLRREGDQAFILELQGFIFFGTANNLLQQVRRRAGDPNLAALRFVALDFRLVSGLDSSAVLSFVKMQQLAESQDFILLLAHLSPAIRTQLRKGGFGAEGEHLKSFPELDRGVEWCEDQILRAHDLAVDEEPLPLAEQLGSLLGEAVDVAALVRFLTLREAGTGDYLMRQGDPPEALYFIETGQVTAQLELPDGTAVRLVTMGAGAVAGELELYLGAPRAASVVAEKPSRIHRLSAAALSRMEEENPDLAAAFHKFIARLMAERLAMNVRTLQALLR